MADQEPGSTADQPAQLSDGLAAGFPAGPLGGPVAAPPVSPSVDPPAEPASALAGQPDGFERLWVPHRMAYIGGEARPADGTPAACPFCTGPTKPDSEALIVARGQHVYAVLNLFPYNPGHLLICPYRHVPLLTDLDQTEACELVTFTQHAMRAIVQARGPHGFNLGINQGSAAGAGIAAHLHQHVVPRWKADSNFFPIVGQTRALPELLGQTRDAIAAAWEDTAC